MRGIAALVLVLLMGCASAAERRHATCTDLGYRPGTEGHRDCQVELYKADQARKGAVIGGWLSR